MAKILSFIGRALRGMWPTPYRLPDGRCGHCGFNEWSGENCPVCLDGWR